MRIRILLYLLIILSVRNYSQNFWEKIESPTTKKLNAVVFADSLRGWAAGDSALIIYTSDGGNSWTTQFSNDSLTIVSLDFLDDQLGIASAWQTNYEPYGTFILKTTNGGVNWNSEYFDIGQSFVNSFYFLDSLTGFAVGYPAFFMRTSDGGNSWRQVNLDSSIYAGFPPYRVKFYNQNYGYASGGVRDVTGVIWRTTDGGLNWDTVVDSSSAPSEPLFAIQIFDSLNVIVMGGDPEYGASLLRTTDAGEFWTYEALEILWYPVDLGFRTETEGWAPMGPKRVFLYTSDSGLSWTQLPTPDSTFITYISFPDSLHGYAVGNNGSIIKYVYQPPNLIKNDRGRISSLRLEQNFPNPFNPATRIEYNIPSAGNVKLKVYDILGNEITTLVNEFKPAGYYSVEFAAAGLPSGIYFYRLQAGNSMLSGKMMLLK